MRTSTILVEDLQGVFAVPPLARTCDSSRAFDFKENDLIVRHITSGGITRLIYCATYDIIAIELERLMNRCVIPLYAIRARRKGYEVSTMKTLMDMAGLCGGTVRPPLVNVKVEEREELREILASWKEFLC